MSSQHKVPPRPQQDDSGDPALLAQSRWDTRRWAAIGAAITAIGGALVALGVHGDLTFVIRW